MAWGPCCSWLPRETPFSSCRTGAGEDGRVFRSGWLSTLQHPPSLLSPSHSLTKLHLPVYFFCSCTVCSWLQQQVIWLRDRATLQHGLMLCMLGHRLWGGVSMSLSVYWHVYMRLLMNKGQFLKMLTCFSDTAVPTLETGQWWQNIFSVLCYFHATFLF